MNVAACDRASQLSIGQIRQGTTTRAIWHQLRTGLHCRLGWCLPPRSKPRQRTTRHGSTRHGHVGQGDAWLDVSEARSRALVAVFVAERARGVTEPLLDALPQQRHGRTTIRDHAHSRPASHESQRAGALQCVCTVWLHHVSPSTSTRGCTKTRSLQLGHCS